MRSSTLVAAGGVAILGATACWLLTRFGADAESASDEASASSAPAAPPRRASAVRVPRVSGRERSSDDEALAAAAAAVADAKADSLALARALENDIRAAAAEKRWNDALKGLNEIEFLCKDTAARASISLDALSGEIVAGRDAYFREQSPLRAYATMDALVADKASQEPAFAVARAWASREVSAELWEKAASNLALKMDELEKYWKERRVTGVRRASYGSGSFVMIKKTFGTVAPSAAAAIRQTEDVWWSRADSVTRSAFLTAYFVETSGYFEILRVDETACEACGGQGECASCNGCGVVRTVTYR